MKIEFCPNEKGSGVESFAGWESRQFHDAMRLLFNASPRERIARLVIDRHGLTAFFETENAARVTSG